SVCVNPCRVEKAAALLKGSGVNVCTVIGFPLGANTPEIKAFETRDAIAKGATEVDMLINIGALKSGRSEDVYQDIKAVVDAANGVLTKVIIETCYLTDEEKTAVCKLAQKAGATFVKTSTGFGTGGATAHDVKLMKDAVGDTMNVKASGGMRIYADVVPVLDAGADRLGVSASIAICEGAPD
ncbi:MAG: deoxyribose-phosphate aldolase, partial [Oscillospiraceae bacterium]|nr:deoxyribose-phosphate aldolase [Oscillospiraceae bacterium]